MFSGDGGNNRYLRMAHGVITSGLREAHRILRESKWLPTQDVSTDTKPQVQVCSVVVVGAGMAGLGAARELIAAGVTDIVILEAQEKAGGRVCSLPFGNSWFELGAQWIHGEDNPIYRIAHKHNLLSGTTSAEGLGPYLSLHGTQLCSSLIAHVSHKISQILEDCERFATDSENYPLSVGHYMRERFEEYLASCPDDTEEEIKLKREIFNWHRRFQEIDNSCSDLDTLSAKDWGKYEFTGGQDCLNLMNGYSSVVDTLVQDLPGNILHLNSHVRKIQWKTKVSVSEGSEQPNNFHLSDGGLARNNTEDYFPVSVVCSDGSVIQAQHVIVTSSIGYLKSNHRELFEPELPFSLSNVIHALGFGTVDKVFMLYDEPWWDEKQLAFQIVLPLGKNMKGEKDAASNWWLEDLTGFDVLSREPATLLAWVGGSGAAHMELLPDDEVAEHCTELLRQCTRRNDIPLPKRVIRSSWFNNPYVKGGYSHTTSECDKQGIGPKDLATPVYCVIEDCIEHPVILLAGEAAHESHFSTTHGAFESGQSQARVIVKYRSENEVKLKKSHSSGGQKG